MNHFEPESPDHFLRKEGDMGLAKFGHLNYLIDKSVTLLGSKTQHTAGVNLNTTADQAIDITGGGKWIVTDIVITNASVNINGAVGGDFYTLPAHAGNLIATPTIANNIRGLNSPSDYMSRINAKLTMGTSVGIGSVLYFSLTTAEGHSAYCDIYVYGYRLPE